MKTLKNFKDVLGEETYDDISIILSGFINEYDFLGWNFKIWDDLAWKIVNYVLKKNNKITDLKFRTILEHQIFKYIKKEYQQNKVRIFNNWIVNTF